jgi:hypothetical protein
VKSTPSSSGDLLRIENERAALAVREDASAEWRDRRTGAVARFGAVGLQEDGPIENGLCWHRTDRLIGEQYACRFRGAALGPDRARFVVLGEDGEERGAFVVRYRLDGECLDVAIEAIDDALPSLCFPTPIASASLVLPKGVGQWLRRPLPHFARRIHRFAGHGLRMRWVGGYLDDEAAGRGWVAIFHRGHADAGVLHAGGALAPVWLRSLGRWQGERVVRYRLTDNGYVGMAKAFRRWAMDNGLFVSLAEKTETRPQLRHLIGGQKLSILLARPFRQSTYDNQWLPAPPWGAGRADGPVVSTTFRQAIDILADARRAGWTKGLAQLPGWSRGGWDDQFPDSWPPEPALGTVAEFEELARTPDPFVAGLLDNYADIYPQSPSYPRGIIRRPDGRFLRGGIWAGGQCRLLDYGQVLDAARRNVAQYVAHGVRAVYCDTTTAVQLYENWDPAHPMTRAEDEQRRVALLRHLRDRGMVVGSEVGCDFGVPVVDWSPSPRTRTPGESVPLWALVFHDAHIGFSTALGHDPDVTAPLTDADRAAFRRGLLDLLVNGLHLGHVRITAGNWPRIRPLVAACPEFDAWMARTGAAEMVAHEFLDAERVVERVAFANGAAVTVNFAGETREAGGTSLPAHGFVVES